MFLVSDILTGVSICSLIDALLKRDSVGSCLILSSSVFHWQLPRKDSESSPKLSVLIVGSLHKFCILRLYVMGFFS